MFPPLLRAEPRPGDTLPKGLGPLHPRAAGGQDRSERKARIRPDGRIRPQVPDRGFELGREIEGRAGPPASRQQPAQGLQKAHEEEPDPGGAHSDGIRGPAPGVRRDRTAAAARLTPDDPNGGNQTSGNGIAKSHKSHVYSKMRDRVQKPRQRTVGGSNPGKKSSKSNWDCTICHSCHCTGPCWTVPR